MPEYISCNSIQGAITFHPSGRIRVCRYTADAAVDVCSAREAPERIAGALLGKRKAMLEDLNAGRTYACCRDCPNLARADWQQAPTRIDRIALHHAVDSARQRQHGEHSSGPATGGETGTDDRLALDIVRQWKARKLVTADALFEIGEQPGSEAGLRAILDYCIAQGHPVRLRSDAATWSSAIADAVARGSQVQLSLMPGDAPHDAAADATAGGDLPPAWEHVRRYHQACAERVTVELVLRPANQHAIEAMIGLAARAGVRQLVARLDPEIPAAERDRYIPRLRKLRELAAQRALPLERCSELPEALWLAAGAAPAPAPAPAAQVTMDNLRRRNLQPFCPICGASGIGFSPLPEHYREMSRQHGFALFGNSEMTSLETYMCKQCGASDRERLYAHWLQKSVDAGLLPRDIGVIHFAPEALLSRYIRHVQLFARYETADLMMPDVDHRGVDLMRLPFADSSYDLFLCSHVLEHVRDDGVALRELRRILKPGGAGLVMAPIAIDLPLTIEDPDETSPQVRWARFGQDDHVRLYSHDDYVRRIERAGFKVMQFGSGYFGSDAFAALGLKPTSILYIALKDQPA